MGNPGIGGYGWSMTRGDAILEGGGKASGETTNNRMELMAAIDCLRHMDNSDTARIHCDSTYVVNGITKWIHRWLRRGFDGVKNADLWLELIDALGTRPERVTWVYVKGHAGVAGNERADAIARGYASGSRPL